MNENQNNALMLVCNAIIETIKESGPLGVPGGILYAALMTQGCTFNQFTGIMGILVRSGKIRKQGDCYHCAEVIV
jgi:hypothetical protein